MAKLALIQGAGKLKMSERQTIDYFNSGIAKHKSEDYTGAIEDFTKAIELRPGYKEAYAARSDSKSALKDFKGAIDDQVEIVRCLLRQAGRNGFPGTDEFLKRLEDK